MLTGGDEKLHLNRMRTSRRRPAGDPVKVPNLIEPNPEVRGCQDKTLLGIWSAW